MIPQVFRWWANSAVATGNPNPGFIECVTDPLNTDGISHLNVMLRMDVPYYGPANSTFSVIAEVSMDGTKWEALGSPYGPFGVGETAFEQRHYGSDNIKRFMRYKFHFLNDGINLGIYVATLDLTGIGRPI